MYRCALIGETRVHVELASSTVLVKILEKETAFPNCVEVSRG